MHSLSVKLMGAMVFAVLLSGAVSAETGFPLQLPLFLTSQTNASTTAGAAFPTQDAGISAYVKVNQEFNLNDVKSAFQEFDAVGDNYIIGVIEIENFGGKSKVRVYVDSDGWMIAFLKRSEATAGIMQWYPADIQTPRIATIPRTTLLDALKLASDALGAGALSQVKYFHFRYPQATNMTLFVKTCAENGSKLTQVQIPTEFVLHEASYYHYGYDASLTQVRVDGTVMSEMKLGTRVGNRTVDSYKGAIMGGALHKIEITYVFNAADWDPDNGSAGVATAIVYSPAASN